MLQPIILRFNKAIEGPDLRELFGDVHSVSHLSSVQCRQFKFWIFFAGSHVTHSLAKLCTLGAANTWALITLPNLPLWTASGAFSLDPGTAGYYSGLNLTVGSTYMSAANDTWQNSGNTGAVGQMQFATQVVNSTLDIAFVQHEPGSAVSTLIDKPFSQNLDECLRYYQKTYDYDVPIQTASSPGAIALTQIGTTALAGPVRFHKPMAKVPAMTAYSYSTGAPNAVRILSTDYAVSGFSVVGKTGFAQLNGTLPANALGSVGFFHYTADTGL